ncbi:MAG TPA: lipase maturation factor family protein, partial [Desulfuromonadaceae bacterium]|nr:lipase maturation factor family protein [Desulfuromonadaceae bacterium]
LDDFALNGFLPRKLAPFFTIHRSPSTNRSTWPRAVTIPVASVIAAVSLFQVAVMLGARSALLYPVAVVHQWLGPFRLVNGYGLFAVMTTERREIIVEGSNDGINWTAYEFRYKPGNPMERPQFVAPFQPRLDWQMWFAALGNAEENPWFENFCIRLLQASPDVLRLLKTNPFPAKPPRYIRAELYDYHFSTAAGRHSTGAWWRRDRLGEYLPPVSLPE